MSASRNIETEPPMHIQRPSSGRSQDVSHILSSVFRELFTREVVGPKTVKNLATSKTGDNSYHDKYVEKLRKIQEERERQIQETIMLETHIMQAQAAAMVSDERELQQAAGDCPNFHDLGLPPVKSHLRYCLDNHLLKSYHLITPDDFIAEDPPPAKPPQADNKDAVYRRDTVSSHQHFRTSLPEDEYYDTPLPIYTPPPTGRSYVPLTAPITTAGKTKSIKSSKWQESMKPEQRQVERTDLKRLQDKLDYLRNPRTVPPGAAQEKVSVVTKSNVRLDNKVELTDLFIPIPNPVVFTNYKPGKVYEIMLDLKNITSASRQVRALPPSTKYFSVGLGQFPGESGIVAPGMSCQFPVKFAPDSLADYDDVIKIKTQVDQPISINVQGRRPPPVLSLSSVLDCGHQLVGGKKTVRFNCHNSGGDGQFCILRKCEWPSTSFPWSLETPGHVSLEPFHIEPAMFELLAGQATTVQITFIPDVAKFFKEHIVMVCDNCHILDFSLEGVGQLAGVEFVSIDGDLSDSFLGESLDSSAQYLIRFDDQNPKTVKDRTMTVKNATNVDLPFRWKILQPDLRCPDTDLPGGSIVYHTHRAIDHSNVFTISPSMGVLRPNDIAHFNVEFKPQEVGSNHNVGHLILEEVPLAEDDSGPLGHGKEVQHKDITSLEIEMKGLCKPCEVLVNPPLMMIPGQLMIGVEYVYSFKMCNNSVSTISFEWNTVQNPHQLTVAPTCGSLAAGEEKDFDLILVGRCPGLLEETIHCSIAHVASPVYLLVKTSIEGPKVNISKDYVDFGLVHLGETTTRQVPLVNSSIVPAKWSLQEAAPFNIDYCGDKQGIELESEFTFIPSYGVLPPGENIDVCVSFTPVKARRVRTVLECRTETGYQSCLAVRGEVQSPLVCLLSCNLILDEVYVNVPITREIVLQNRTLLHAEFSWEEGIGSNSGHCRTFFQPSYGQLGPAQAQTIQVTFTSTKEGDVEDLFYPCHIRGVNNPTWLAVKTLVRGLNVSCKTPKSEFDESELESDNDADEDLSLEFGEVLLGANLKTVLVLTNTSAIRTTFSLEMEHFKAKPPTPPAGSPQGKGSRRTAQGLLGRTPNISDPFSKTASKAHSDHCLTLLRDGRGAAFVPFPASGELSPFGRQIIEVTSYSDMWGDYNDNLICKVAGLENKMIHVHMNVQGCPLNYQMVKHGRPVLRFGTHVSGAKPVTRSLRVNNTSSYDIRIDWQTFNVFPDDHRVIDLVWFIGEAFPRLCDEKEQADDDSNEDSAVKLILQPHEGERADAPFHVQNSQQVIPAKGYANMVVQFSPHSESLGGVQCEAFILGFMSLDYKDINIEGKVSRKQGLDTDPFRLDITAGIKPALLSIEMEDDEGSMFICPASNLLKKKSDGSSYEVSSSFLCCHHMTLTNNSESPLTFFLTVPKPFTILSLDYPHSAKKERSSADGSTTLKIGRNLGVEVALSLSSEIIRTRKETDNTALVTDANGLKSLQFREDFHVDFNNNTSQILSLSGIVALPALRLSRQELNFGVCLVGQSKELLVDLDNLSSSASYWVVTQDQRYPEVSRDKFSLSPTRGYLEANISNISKNKQILKIVFTARHNVEYECMFIFSGLLQEEPQHLTVRGRGTYDQKHEQLVHILTQ